MDRQVSSKCSHLQLAFLGVVALTIGIVCMLDVVLIYHLPAITSISESATTGNRAGMLLPFALGCMFTYCIAYVGYCPSERKLTRVMALGFAVAAMQLCNSPYITEKNVGLLGLSPQLSNVLHSIGALIGFGAMFVWIAFFFTRSVPRPTPQKLRRNQIYVVCATLMAAGILLFIIGTFVVMGRYSVFIAEEFMLMPAGFALLVKSGLLFADK